MDLELLTEQPAAGTHCTPILFLHGAYHGAWCYRHWLPYFADHGFAAYAMSLRGHGATRHRDDLHFVKLEDYVEDIGVGLAQIGRPAVLVGHAMSGPLALVVGARFARLTRAVVLLASAAPQATERKRAAAFRQALASDRSIALAYAQATIQAKLRSTLHHPITTVELFRRAFLSPDIAPHDLHAYFPLIQPESPLAVHQINQGTFRPDLSGLTAPVSLVGAHGDVFVSADDVRATAAMFRTEARFSRGGSDLMLDTYWIEAAAQVLEALSACGIPAGGVVPLRQHSGVYSR
jgi:pimeloyl-ACP methyl ester carboxylesterase